MGAIPADRVAAFHSGRVEYPGIYAGIDAVVYSSARQLEFDFVVAPGARVETVRLGVQGASVELDANGNAVLSFGSSSQRQLVLRSPRTHQTVGREWREVASRFTLQGSGVLGIEVGSYDPGLTLVVDPVVLRTFSDGGNSIAVDSLDEVYIVGVQDRLGDLDVVVTTKAFQTVLRGGGDDIPTGGIAVDPAGNVYVAGRTASTDFPTTPGSFQTTYGGGREDAWVAKLDALGNVLYATYLGGVGIDRAYDITVNAAGESYVVGLTDSSDYPLEKPFQTYQGSTDGFITRLDPTGSKLVYSTCFGGPSRQSFYGVAIDPAGHIYAAGICDHGVMPIKNAFQSVVGGGGDGFLVKFEPDGADIVFSTYLGGSRHNEAITAVALDPSGNIYVTGFTDSHDFPVRNAFQPIYGDPFLGRDAFVAAFQPDGADLVYSTYLGGNSGFHEMGIDIAVDRDGRAFVLGEASAANFPLWDPLQPVFGGGLFDGFIAAFENDGAVVYSSFWGGPGDDVWHQSVEGGVALDSCGTPYYILPLRRAQQIGDPPVIACPPDLTLACPWDTDPSATGEPSIISGFCPTPTCTYIENRILLDCGRTTGYLHRAWTCTDGRDTKTCAQRIDLADTIPPVVTMGSILDCYPDAASAGADAIAATAAVDDCGHPVTFDAAIWGSCSATITVTAKDTCGNAASVDYATTIDGVPPTLAGVPADATVECDAVPAPAVVTASDDCDLSPALSFVERRIDSSCTDRYTLERVWTATDRCGNVGRAVQVVTVVDTIPPAILGVPPDETAECDAVPPPASPAAKDSCDPAPALRFAERRLDGDCADRYTLVREWIATDRCGNESTAIQTVAVVDTTPPEPKGALVPTAPRSARSPSPPASVCSPPTHRLVRIECEPLVDNCDPTPVLRAKLLATHHDVPAKGVCVPRIDAIEVDCGEVVEIRLVARSCPLKPPRSPRPSLSVTSAGLKIISGESVILHVEGIDRCGNAAVFDWDPAKEPSPLCDEVLNDGTCCPAIGAPPSPKCGVPPCGTATLLLGDPTGESRTGAGREGSASLTGRYDRRRLGSG